MYGRKNLDFVEYFERVYVLVKDQINCFVFFVCFLNADDTLDVKQVQMFPFLSIFKRQDFK